jgi:hypothetical protein
MQPQKNGPKFVRPIFNDGSLTLSSPYLLDTPGIEQSELKKP